MGCAMRLVVPIRQNAEYTLVACDVWPRGQTITNHYNPSQAKLIVLQTYEQKKGFRRSVPRRNP